MLHRARGVEEIGVEVEAAGVCEDSTVDGEPDIMNNAVVSSHGDL